jgi:ABC-2 type transport system ATP-binding protein
MPGVEQVAAFGQTIHVVGSDRAAMETSIRNIAARYPVQVETGETTLEDVFIRLMGEAQANGDGR